MFKLSIKSKLFILVLVVLIPLIILQVSRINIDFNEKVLNELNANEQFAEAVSIAFTNFIDQIIVQENLIGLYITQAESMPVTQIQSYLESIQTKRSTLLGTSWIGPDGIVLASSQKPIIGVSLTDRKYIHDIIKGSENVISNLELSKTNGKPIVIIAHAVRKNNKLVGIISSVIDISNLSSRLPTSKISTASRFGLIDKNGIMVYRSDTTDIKYNKRKISNTSPAWRALKGELVKTLKRTSGTDGTVRMGVDYPIKQIGWDCFVTTSYESAMAKNNVHLRNDFIILLIVSLLSITLAYVFGKKALKPLTGIKTAVDSIKQGDFSARTNIQGYDELAATAEAFDSMAEAIEKNDKMKTQFFTNLSHELKTPVNVILAATQLVQNTGLLDIESPNYNKINTQMSSIRQNCYRLIRMISNLIDVSRYDNGYLPIKLNNYNIVQIVEDITLSVAKFAQTKEIALVFDTNVEEKFIACDPDMIERIILNILSNSLKFTDKNGYIKVTIHSDIEYVRISIKDNGIGIPKDKLDLIFERFGQVDDSLSRNHEGSGIGLSLVKSLVKMHGGNIEVVSEPNKGTEIMVNLPSKTLLCLGSPDSPMTSSTSSQSIVERISIEFSDIYDLR